METNERRNDESDNRNEFWGGEQLDSGSWASDMDDRFASAEDSEEEYDDYELSPDENLDDESWESSSREGSSDSQETMPYRSDRHNGWQGNPTGDGGYGSQGGEP